MTPRSGEWQLMSTSEWHNRLKNFFTQSFAEVYTEFHRVRLPSFATTFVPRTRDFGCQRKLRMTKHDSKTVFSPPWGAVPRSGTGVSDFKTALTLKVRVCASLRHDWISDKQLTQIVCVSCSNYSRFDFDTQLSSGTYEVLREFESIASMSSLYLVVPPQYPTFIWIRVSFNIVHVPE